MNDPIIRDNFVAVKSVLYDRYPQTAPLLAFLAKGACKHAYLYNESVLLTAGDFAMVSSDCEEDLCVLLQAFEKPGRISEVFCAEEDWSETVALCFQCDGGETFYQFATATALPETDCPFPIRLIGDEQTDAVFAMYSGAAESEDETFFGSKPYIRKRLQEAPAFGAFDGEKLIGCIFTHEAGSMGGLEVLPDYRKNGIGEALERKMISHLLNVEKQGRVYCHVATDNKASLSLQFKLGLDFCEQNVVWMWRTRKWINPKKLEERSEGYTQKDK